MYRNKGIQFIKPPNSRLGPITPSIICSDIQDQFIYIEPDAEEEGGYRDLRDPIITSSPDFPLPEGHLGCILYTQMDRFNDKIAQVNCMTGGMDSFATLKLRSTCVAQALKNYGLKPGDVIVVMSRNLIEVYDVFLACLYNGITVSFLHSDMGRFGITHLLFTIKPKLIFCECSKLEILQTCLSRLYWDTDLIYFGTTNDGHVTESDTSIDTDDIDFNYETYKNRQYSDTDIQRIAHLPKNKCTFFSIYKDTCTCCRCQEYGLLNEFIDYKWEGKAIPFYTLIIDTEDVEPFKLIHIEDATKYPAILSIGYGNGGLPKPIVMSHANLMHQMLAFRATFEKTDRVLQYTSLYRIIGVVVFLHALYTGACRLYHPKYFDVQTVFTTISKYKPNKLIMTPWEMWTMTKYQLRYHYNLCSVTEILLGPNVVSNRLKVMTQQLFPKSSVTVWFGYPELGVISMTDPQTITSHSVGKLLSGIRAKVVDPETKVDNWRTDSGHLCIKMPTSFMGCFIEEDGILLNDDGWYNTSDLAVFDFCDCLYIRKTNPNRVLQKGYTFSTYELETVLYGHDMIQTAVVVKIPHTELGEIASAFVVLQPHKKPTEENIFAYTTKNLASFKKISGGIKFRKKIPKIRVLKERVPDRETLTALAIDNFKKAEEIRTKRAQRACMNYLKDREIIPFFGFLAGHMLSDEPDNPVKYLCKLLKQCLNFRDKNGEPPNLFTIQHLKSICHEMAGPHGGINEYHFEQGMRALNIKCYSVPPERNKHNLIEIKTFVMYAHNLELLKIKKMLRIRNKIPRDHLLDKKEKDEGKCVACI